MGVFESCKTVQQVLDILRSMKEAGTLTFSHELLGELRIIEIQSNDRPPALTESDTENEPDQNITPPVSPEVHVHVSYVLFLQTFLLV
jgi:hypothetical protein